MKSALSFIQIIILALCAQTVNAVGPGQSMQILQPSINVPTTKFFDGSKRITLNAFRGTLLLLIFGPVGARHVLTRCHHLIGSQRS